MSNLRPRERVRAMRPCGERLDIFININTKLSIFGDNQVRSSYERAGQSVNDKGSCPINPRFALSKRIFFLNKNTQHLI